MLLRRVFLLLALCVALSARAERLPFRTYTTADGLAGDAVRDLLLDSRGFLWIATSSGLSRFDGQVFRNYDTPDGLPSPRVSVLYETRDGTIWVGTTEGLARLHPTPAAGQPLFAVERLPAGTTAFGVSCFLEDRAGRLWICLGGGLVVLDDPSQGAELARRIELPAGASEVDGVVEDGEGSFWIASSRGLLRLLPDGSYVLYPARPPDDGVKALSQDRDGRLWMVGTGGLYIFWPEPLDEARHAPRATLAQRARRPRAQGELPGRPGTVFLYDRAGGLVNEHVYTTIAGRTAGTWGGTGGGVSHFANGALRSIRPAQGLAEASVMAVLEDAEGTLWLGTESRGLARLARSGFVSFGEEDGLAGDRVSGQFEGPAGELYVVTWPRGIQRFDGRRFVNIMPRRLAGALPGWGWNQFFLRDRAGAWWIPTSNGLFRFAPVARPDDLRGALPAAHYGKGSGLPGDDVFRLYQDRAGDLWVSVIAVPPLVRFVGGARPVGVPEIRGASTGGAPTAFAEDAAGGLWMGFYVGGLARLRNGRWRFFGTADGVPPGFVADLHCDRAGRLWVATTAGGIARVDNPAAETPRFVRYTTADGLTTHSARCLAEGPGGHLYIGTARGIDRLHPASGRIRSFSAEDGLPNNLVWTCYAARDGSLWFGTLHGLARLDPRQETSHRPPVVLISGLKARGVPLPVSELGTRELSGLVLAPDQSSLQIDFLGIGLSLGPNLLFQTRLEGVDGDWSAPTRTRSVIFPRLAPGSYRFLVRAVTRDGLISAVPAAVSFRLLPPVWRRPWFLALLGVLAAGAVWAAHRLRLRRLLAIERVRTRIAADLHDDVGASLARIGLLGDLAGDRLAADPQQAGEMLAQIGAEARELADTTSDIVWAVDPRKDDLESLLIRLRRFAADLLEAQAIRLRFEAPPDCASVALAPETRRGLYLVLKEAIHNIAKHSRATAAGVRVEVRGRTILGEVWDDGIGIDATAAADAEACGRRGLVGMRERARFLSGDLDLDSAPGRGTRLTIRVPLAKSAPRGSA